MTENEARKILDEYIAKEDADLSIVGYEGERFGDHYFICKCNLKLRNLPGQTNAPILAVLQNGEVMATPT